MRKVLPILGLFCLIGTIAISYLSNTGFFNGNTMASLSARYQSFFTPAPYAFSIWGLIYLELLVFSGFQLLSLRGNPEAIALVDRIGPWFILSSLANSAWVLSWLYDYTGLSVLIMGFLFFTLLRIILLTDMELTDPPLRTIVTIWWPICLYSGWISVAFFANVSAWFVKIHWDGFGLSAPNYTVLLITLAAMIHLWMTWTRNMREFAMVGVWALIAIGVANSHRPDAGPVEMVAYVFAAVLFLSSSIHGYLNRAAGPFRKRTADSQI